MNTEEFERRLELVRQQGAPEEVIRQVRLDREERLKNPWNGDERSIPADVWIWQGKFADKLNRLEDIRRCEKDQNIINREVKKLNDWIKVTYPKLSINDTY